MLQGGLRLVPELTNQGSLKHEPWEGSRSLGYPCGIGRQLPMLMFPHPQRTQEVHVPSLINSLCSLSTCSMPDAVVLLSVSSSDRELTTSQGNLLLHLRRLTTRNSTLACPQIPVPESRSRGRLESGCRV